MLRNASLAIVVLCASACASAGPWGHAPDYAPISGEAEAIESARELDPIMAKRAPEDWTKTPVQFFGVVLKGQPGDPAVLEVSLRRLAPRNLCSAADSDSCRVTVSDRDFGTVRVVLQLTPAERSGPEMLASGSLLRLVGVLKSDPEAPEKLLLQATWHRHWPRGYYVTESFREEMRR